MPLTAPAAPAGSAPGALAGGDPYATLNVRADASAEELRTAYRRAALSAHPDKGGSAEAFHGVAAAFEALSCPVAGQSSERERAAKRQPPAGQPPAPPPRQRRGAPAAAEEGGDAAPEAAARGAAQLRESRAARLGRVRALLRCMDKEARHASILRMAPRVRAALVDFMRSGAEEQDPDEPAVRPPPRRRGGPGAVRLREVRGRAGAKYSAQLDVESLRVYTRKVPLEDALEAQLALAQARDRLASAGPEVWESPAEVCAAFGAALREPGAGAGRWGLAVFVQMRAPEMVAGSVAITSPAMALPQAVELRRRLLAARAASWERFRAEWVALLAGGRRGLSQEEAPAARARGG
ncbi:unnamed protein product, partial [Prorocentrum cordatum]